MMLEVLPLTTDHEIKTLSRAIENAHQNPSFMEYLLESPMTRHEIYQVLSERVESNWMLFGIVKNNDLIGYNLYFSNSKVYIPNGTRHPEENLELSFRILPHSQSKWVCTQAVAASLHQLFQEKPELQTIEWRHSVYNRWSYHVFRRSGFTLTNYVPEWVNLPNRDPDGTKTDILGRKIHRDDLTQTDLTQTDLTQASLILPKIIDADKQKIIAALRLHELIPQPAHS